MNIKSRKSYLLCFLLPAIVAHAKLGERIDRDEIYSKAEQKNIISKQKFSIYETKTPMQTIRQFVSSDGIVFAYVCRGLQPCAHSKLLGESYKDEYVDAYQKQKIPGRRSFAIHGSKFTVEHGGTTAFLISRAYDLSLFPEGVTLNEISIL